MTARPLHGTAWFQSIYEIPFCMLYTAAEVIPEGNLKYSVCSLRLEFYLQYFWHNSINMEYLNALHTLAVQLLGLMVEMPRLQ